jgi:hypothetical protein
VELYGDMGDAWEAFWLRLPQQRCFLVAEERDDAGEATLVGCVGVKEGHSMTARVPLELNQASLWRLTVAETCR